MPVQVNTAAGVVVRSRIILEVQLVTASGEELTPWLIEECTVCPVQQGIPTFRLSGNKMRQHLYFATAPGNTSPYVAQKKSGIVTQLPVV